METPAISESVWREAFGNEERPTLYSSNRPLKNNFAALTSPKRFMKDMDPLSHVQLYLLAENCQLALKTAQDEYLHIERLVRRLEQKDSPVKPQTLLDPDRFEEEKESTLYGFKRIPRGMPYTRTKDGTEFYGFQEPFSQGGFVPTDAQYKRMKANAKDPSNIDGWTPIERDGKKLIPRMPRSPPPRQRGFTGTLTRPSRKRRIVDQGFSDTDATAVCSDSDAFDTPNRHQTRFLGRKIPVTRDPSETPASHRGSPAPQRHHKFVMNRLTQALLSTSTSTHLSINSTPAPSEISPTPSPSNKRRRTTQQNPKPRFNPSTNPRQSPSQYDPSEDKKWTDASLLAAINTDHSFLHPDPEIALSWKTAIIKAPNPVRSYAMKRKWAWWRKGGMDKRPRRGWREGTGEGDESQENEPRDGPAPRTEMKEDRKKPEVKMEQENSTPARPHHQPLVFSTNPPPNRIPDPNGDPDTKSLLAKQQQKDRQYTFKLDHPPPPLLSQQPPYVSATWLADEEGGGRKRGGQRMDRLSPPPPPHRPAPQPPHLVLEQGGPGFRINGR